MSYHPLPVTHVGLTVTDIAAATKWYQDVFHCRHIIGPLHIKHDGSYQRRVKTSTGRVLDESWPPVELGGGLDPVRIVGEIAAPLCQDLIEIG